MLQHEMKSLRSSLGLLEADLPLDCSIDVFARFLYTVCREGVRDEGLVRDLHCYLCKRGLEVYGSLGSRIISLMLDVGLVHSACQVVNKLQIHGNELSWNSLIKGFVRCGSMDHAFTLYDLMRSCAFIVFPDGNTFLPLIRACITKKDYRRGLEIHADAVRTGWIEKDHFIASALVDLYGRCGWNKEAQNVFDYLSFRDSVSWTVLIAGYAEHGHGHLAMKSFDQMQHEGVPADAVTYVSYLKACSSMRARDRGQQTHVKMENIGCLEGNNFVGSALVSMYANCGLLFEAQDVLEKICTQDVVLWNSLMTGYLENHRDLEALQCFEKMKHRCIFPNSVTYICSLKACRNMGALDMGREMHCEIVRRGVLEHDPLVGSTIVDMYAEFGLLAKAHEVFEALLIRDVVSWNALITGYSEHGYADEALHCFEIMRLEGISPDSVTFTFILRACSSVGAISKTLEMHHEIDRKGLLKEKLIGNTLIDTYGDYGLLSKALDVFDELPDRDIVSWNALIAGYIQNECNEKALQCFVHMQIEGLSPDEVTLLCCLKACSNVGAVCMGEEIHAEVEEKGLLERDPFLGSMLIDMYAKSGLLVKAQNVFDKLPVKDQVAWNALITGYAEHGQSEQALEDFDEMKLMNCSPNAVTVICCLKACSAIGAIDKGQHLHVEVAKMGLLDQDLVVGNSLVDMYAKCGSLLIAQQIFDRLIVQDIVSWNALISGYSMFGECRNVLAIFHRMLKAGTMPDVVSFVIVLSACSRVGLFEKGQNYFEAMSKDFGIRPIVEHHICMVDALSRAGELDGAFAMVKRMPLGNNLVTWHTMLNACGKWGNAEIGRKAFEHALSLDRTDSASYTLMARIYTDS